MKNIFQLKRFALYFRKTIVERPYHTIGAIVLLLILTFIMYVVVKKIFWFGPAQNLTFIWGLAGGGFLLSSFVFGYFEQNASGSTYLTLPVSSFEKWLVAILLPGIIYPVLFLIFFHLMDLGFVEVYHRSLDPASPFYKEQYNSVFPFDLNGFVAWKVYPMFLMLTGIMLSGSLYFNKIPLIKTGIAVCVILFVVIGANWLIAGMFFKNIRDVGPFDHVTLNVGKTAATLLLPAPVEGFFKNSLSFVIPAILWVLPLIRLKEKEF